MRLFVPLLLAALCGGPALAAPPAPAASQTVLPKGTPVRLRLDSDLRSGRDKVGQAVLFSVTQDVYGPGHVLLLAKNTPACGHVTESARRGALGRAGKLTFTCDAATAGDGTRVPLSLKVTTAPPSDAAGEVVVSATAGVRRDPFNDSGLVSPGNFTSGIDPTGPEGQLPEAVYRQNGGAAAADVDVLRALGSGADASAGRGQAFEATVTADTPLGPVSHPAPGPAQVFTLKDKTQVVGTLVSLDGQAYTVQTPSGRRSLRAVDVQSIQAAPTAPALGK